MNKMLYFFKLVFVFIVLQTVYNISLVACASSGDVKSQSGKNASSILHFSVQLLQRIRNYIFNLKPQASAPKEKVKSSDGLYEKVVMNDHSTGVPLESEEPTNLFEDILKRPKLIGMYGCPAVTYRSLMLNVTDAFSNVSSENDDSTSSNRKMLCDPLPLNDTSRGTVQILNHTQLIETKVRRKDNVNERSQSSGRKTLNSRSVNDVDLANGTRDKLTYCVMMMVYAHFCPFSKNVAPVYVALARVYPQIAFYAIHIHDYKRVKSTMSAFGVPKIFLLKNGRTVSVFNKSVKSFDVLKSFVHNLTGFTALENVTNSSGTNVNNSETVLDYGPFTFNTEEFDIYLLFSWAFILCLIANYFLCSSQGERLRRRVVQLWQEHEHVN